MRKLWAIMTEMFHHRWTGSVGRNPTPLWSATCAEFTDEQFQRAVSKLKDSMDEWPPSLPEFRRWALGAMSRDEAKLYAERRAEREVQALIENHNPFSAGPTYEEAEKMRRRLTREYFVEATGGEPNSIALEGPDGSAALEHGGTLQ